MLRSKKKQLIFNRSLSTKNRRNGDVGVLMATFLQKITASNLQNNGVFVNFGQINIL